MGPVPETKVKPNPLEELTSAGWVSVPNSGKLTIDAPDELDAPRRASASGSSADPIAVRDVARTPPRT